MSKAPPPPRGRPLAWHLGVLCAALLVPMFALEAFLLVQMANGERARHLAEARETARRIAVSLDRGLTTLQAMLEVLATHEHLRASNFDAFRRRAREVLESTGTEISLRDRQGRTLVNTGSASRGGAPDPDADRAALETGRPQITDLLPAEEGQPRRFAIVAPAAGPGGERDYVIELSVPVKALDDVLRRDEIPAGMTASVVDRRGSILARSVEPERFVGTSLSPNAPARTEMQPEGWRRTADSTGTVVVLAWSRSELAGWTTAVFLPEAVFEAPVRRSLWSAAALGAVLAALAAALAFVFARRIARPIAALAGIAGNAGDRAALATPVREVNEVGRALTAARAEALAREREREDLLRTLDRAQVIACDLDGRVKAWTGGAERLFGWSRGEAIGRMSDELLATGFPRPLPEIKAELLARGEWQGELRRGRRDGAALVVASHWALRRSASGEPLAVIEVCTDITAAPTRSSPRTRKGVSWC
jgi:PAS domain S-box-containing protein